MATILFQSGHLTRDPRYFGTGVIIATGFIQYVLFYPTTFSSRTLTITFHSLLDPAYSEIGPLTCVGMTGGWASYSWPPALALLSALITFLLDFAAERYVETKYGLNNMGETNVENLITTNVGGNATQVHAPAHAHDLDMTRTRSHLSLIHI